MILSKQESRTDPDGMEQHSGMYKDRCVFDIHRAGESSVHKAGSGTRFSCNPGVGDSIGASCDAPHIHQFAGCRLRFRASGKGAAMLKVMWLVK